MMDGGGKRESMNTSKITKAFMAALTALTCMSTVKAEGESETIYRFYNPNSGEHFYTADVEVEGKHLEEVGWTAEGYAWTSPKESDTPVYRLYNPNAGDHHYTTDKDERDALVKLGWNDEGIGWYSDDSKAVAVYRLYNPNAVTGTHHYTLDETERAELIKLGWNDENIGWYSMKADHLNGIFFNSENGCYYYYKDGHTRGPVTITYNGIKYSVDETGKLDTASNPIMNAAEIIYEKVSSATTTLNPADTVLTSLKEAGIDIGNAAAFENMKEELTKTDFELSKDETIYAGDIFLEKDGKTILVYAGQDDANKEIIISLSPEKTEIRHIEAGSSFTDTAEFLRYTVKEDSDKE